MTISKYHRGRSVITRRGPDNEADQMVLHTLKGYLHFSLTYFFKRSHDAPSVTRDYIPTNTIYGLVALADGGDECVTPD